MTLLSLKRGAAPQLDILLQDDNGAPVALAGLTLASQLRDALNPLVADLPIIATATPGLAKVLVLDTARWPLGVMQRTMKGAAFLRDLRSIMSEASSTAAKAKPAAEPATRGRSSAHA